MGVFVRERVKPLLPLSRKVLHLLARLRSREKIALTKVAAMLSEEIKLRFVLHPFGYDLNS